MPIFIDRGNAEDKKNVKNMEIAVCPQSYGIV